MDAIAGSIAAAAAFLSLAWRGAWLALVLLTLVLAPVVGDAMGLEPLVNATLLILVAIGLYVVARGALWRLALAAGKPGPGGLQFGAVELRMCGAWSLAFSFLAIITGVLFVAMLVIAYAVASTGPGFDPARSDTWVGAADWRGRIVLAAAMTMAVLALAYSAARISLGEAASVDRSGSKSLTGLRTSSNRLVMLSTWPTTRRRWPVIVAANVLLAAPPLLAVFAWPNLRVPARLAPLLGAIVIAWLWLPMNVGALAWFYRDAQEETPA